MAGAEGRLALQVPGGILNFSGQRWAAEAAEMVLTQLLLQGNTEKLDSHYFTSDSQRIRERQNSHKAEPHKREWVLP